MGLRPLGLRPVARGRSRWIYVTARGRLGYPEGSATGSQWTTPTLLLGQRSTITTGALQRTVDVKDRQRPFQNHHIHIHTHTHTHTRKTTLFDSTQRNIRRWKGNHDLGIISCTRWCQTDECLYQVQYCISYAKVSRVFQVTEEAQLIHKLVDDVFILAMDPGQLAENEAEHAMAKRSRGRRSTC